MASILAVGDRWRAQVRRAGRKSIAKTFEKRQEAERWARRIERELDQQDGWSSPLVGLGNVRGAIRETTHGADTKLVVLIREYRRIREELGRPIDPQSNTNYMLEHLEEDLGTLSIDELRPARMVQWARQRKEHGAGGYTVNMELSQLGTLLRHCASFLGIAGLPDVVGAARPLLNYGQLITGGGRRTRRPSQDELAALLDWIEKHRDPVVADAVRVAAITGLRRAELARIVWSDLDREKKAVLVRQRKHPRRIESRDEWVPLLGDAWGIVQRQALVDERIFPVSREKLTDTVTAGTKALGIPDLRLHDMRREATSALRDMGFDSDARKAVTGHKSDSVHSRYVAVTLEELHRRYDGAQDVPQDQPRPRTARARPRAAKGTRQSSGGS